VGRRDTRGRIITFSPNEEGNVVNEETGEALPAVPDYPPTETFPDWLWDQHLATPPVEGEA
jgi:hypothetical protein